MDLGLINHKLTNDEYEGREPFVEDLRLVFSNAVQFNRPAAQQAQSQQELNPHFVMDDLAAKTYAIATHLLNYVDHLELEYFKVRDSASVSELQVASTASARCLDAIDATPSFDAGPSGTSSSVNILGRTSPPSTWR